MSEKYNYANISSSQGEIRGSSDGYSVFAKKQISSGEIIEECPAVEITTTLEQLFVGDDIIDVPLFLKTVPFITGEQGKTGLCLVGGNYVSYKQSDEYNAVYQHDRRFDIITIRAIKDIPSSGEIILPFIETKSKTKPIGGKKRDCGCGKKKKTGDAVNSTSGPDKILKDKPVIDPFTPKSNNKTSNFKSMVDGETLKSIEVDK